MTNAHPDRKLLSAVAALCCAGLLFSCAAAPKAPAPEPESGAALASKPASKPAAPGDVPSPSAAPKADDSLGGLDKREKVMEDRASAELVPGRGVAGRAPAGKAGSSGLKAGFSDDNAQFNYFADFLAKYAEVPHYDFPVGERVSLKVLDSDGKPVPNARVRVRVGARTVDEGLTYSDGGFRLYPEAYGGDDARYEVSVEAGSRKSAVSVERAGPRTVEVRLQSKRQVPAPVPLDVLFVMDTTGSMGEEIERLRATVEIIYANIAALSPKPDVRFGLVLYRDVGDDYVTRTVDFTGNLDAFQRHLDQVGADGGGDGPEDLQSALSDAVRKVSWNKDGLRVAFVVTDAPPHLDYGQAYTYLDAAKEARAKAIKFFTVGTGGLPLEGEYVLRQLSQLTDARYIFLTYGEGGEAEGGAAGSVSHHTGANFATDKLEAIVIRFVKEEVARLSDAALESGEDYFQADKVADETRDQTLDKLFSEALKNLSDYSTYKLGPTTKAAILPVASPDAAYARTAEYFGERLQLVAARDKPWTLVERKDLQKILAELELQLSGLADEGSAAKVGALMGAEVLVSGNLLRRGEGYELFLKLVRVSTGEVLSVSRAKLAADLGL